MKRLFKIKLAGGLICCLVAMKVFAQNDKPELMLNLRHFTENNSVQYLKVQAQLKADNKLKALQDVSVRLYLDSVSKGNLIGTLKTNENGSAQITIPASLKQLWDVSPNHKFIATAKSNPDTEQTTAELEIAKAKIEIDTLNENRARSVTAKILSYNNGEWLPAKDVEVKIGVERLNGNLKIGDEESYTTDSLGQVTGEFKLDSLPANDKRGNIVLTARVEDNEQFGDLLIEKTVPWGKYYQHVNTFGQRSLWAARFKAPLWLLFMAYSIVAGVWGVIIFLIIQVFRMKKLGAESGRGTTEKLPTEKLVS